MSMKADVASKFTELWLPSSVLILFVALFVVMILFVWRKSGKSTYAMAEQLPFDEGNKK